MDEGNGSFSDNEDEKSSEDLGCPSLSSDSDEHDGSDGGHLQNDSRQEEEDHCVDGLGVPEMDEAPKSEPSGGRRRRRREKNTKKKNADLDEDPSKGWDQSLDPSAIMRMSRLAERQAADSEWPLGPENLEDLFRWPEFNADVLSTEKKFMDTFRKLSECDIEIYESYAGTGTASTSMKQQYFALLHKICGTLRKDQIVTKTMTEWNGVAQKLLLNLHEDYRPKHVFSNLDHHITEDARHALSQARQAVDAEIDWKVRMGDGKPLSKEELANYGEDLLDRYMDILSDPECFVKKTHCLACKSDCLTAYGHCSEADSSSGRRKVKIYTGGSTCTDVSVMGNLANLLGDSSRYLSIWLSEIIHSEPEVAIHECTAKFGTWLFKKYLSELYELHEMSGAAGDDESGTGTCSGGSKPLLSPHQFGWPCYRPRLYSCLVKKSVAHLAYGGTKNLVKFFRQPNMTAAALYCAPQDEVDAERLRVAHSAKKPLTSTFSNLLKGTKSIWLKQYRNCKKVIKAAKRGKGTGCLICNLQQNPGSRPIVSMLLPTLLRNGCMWILRLSNIKIKNEDNNSGCESLAAGQRKQSVGNVGRNIEGRNAEERYLLGKERMIAMGLPMYYFLASRTVSYPLFGWVPTDNQCRKLAGNAMHANVIGSVCCVLLTTLTLEPLQPVQIPGPEADID